MHLISLGREIGIDVGLDDFDRFSRKVPVISKVIPTGRATVLDLYSASGVPVITGELPSLMNERAKTVSGKTVGEIIMNVGSTDTRVITTIKEPLFPSAGIDRKGRVNHDHLITLVNKSIDSQIQFLSLFFTNFPS